MNSASTAAEIPIALYRTSRIVPQHVDPEGPVELATNLTAQYRQERYGMRRDSARVKRNIAEILQHHSVDPAANQRLRIF